MPGVFSPFSSPPLRGLALFVFLVARPVSVLVAVRGNPTPWRIRGLASWFGVCGIGSLFYLMFPVQHGLPVLRRFWSVRS